jgi:hypothetical protein
MTRRCQQQGILRSRKPSRMVWPAIVPVKIELWPEAKRAMPKRMAAAGPAIGCSRR